MTDVAEAMAGLRARFLVRAADDLATLRQWQGSGAAPDDDLRRLVHRLAGAAGTFGFPALGDVAKSADDRLADGEAPSAVQFTALLTELEGLVEGAGHRAV